VVDVGVRFDSAGAMAELRRNLVAAMKQLQQEYIDEVRSQMRDHEHTDSWYEGEVTVLANMIMAEVVGGAWAAMDAEGTGSLMDMNNPALEEYMSSESWNPERDRADHKIVSRARKNNPQQNIFGDMVNTRSNRGGIDLERKGGKFAPRPPSHAPQEVAARWMANGRMQEVLQGAVSAVNWTKYFVETKE
jgi:hypothetical protein